MPEENIKKQMNSGTVRDIDWLRRNVSADEMAALAHRLELELPLDTENVSRGVLASAIVEAVASLDEPAQDEVGRVLEAISTVGRTRKHVRVMCDFIDEKRLSAPDGLPSRSCPSLAVWCYLNLDQEQWSELRGRIDIENFKHWRAFALDFKEEPAAGKLEEHRKEIERAVSRWVFENEHRGKNSDSRCYVVGDKEYLVLVLTDYTGAGQFWSMDKGEFTNLSDARLVPGFHVIVTFNRETARMNILYPQSKAVAAACKAICSIVCDTAFGKDACGRRSLKYNLAPLFSNEDLPKKVKGLGIEDVELVYLEFALDESARHIRAFGEKDGNLHALAREELSRYRDGEEPQYVEVRRGNLKFSYVGSDGKLKRKTIELSQTSSNIGSASGEAQRIINAYLALDEVGIINGENS